MSDTPMDNYSIDNIYTEFSNFLLKEYVYSKFIEQLGQNKNITLREHCNTIDIQENLVLSAFTWDETKGGHSYWSHIDKSWREHFEQLRSNDTLEPNSISDNTKSDPLISQKTFCKTINSYNKTIKELEDETNQLLFQYCETHNLYKTETLDSKLIIFFKQIQIQSDLSID